MQHNERDEDRTVAREIHPLYLGMAFGLMLLIPTRLSDLIQRHSGWHTELTQLLCSFGIGAIAGCAIALPILVKRWRRGERLFPHTTTPCPRWAWLLGMAVFGLGSVTSFLGGLPVHGWFFGIMALIYTAGLIMRCCFVAKRNSSCSDAATR